MRPQQLWRQTLQPMFTGEKGRRIRSQVAGSPDIGNCATTRPHACVTPAHMRSSGPPHLPKLSIDAAHHRMSLPRAVKPHFPLKPMECHRQPRSNKTLSCPRDAIAPILQHRTMVPLPNKLT
jgi:hypothetical protein